MKNPENPLQLAEFAATSASSSSASSAPLTCLQYTVLSCEVAASDTTIKAAELELVLTNGKGQSIRGKSDALGHFSFAGLNADGAYTLAIDSQDWAISSAAEHSKSTGITASWEDGPSAGGSGGAGKAVRAGWHYVIQVNDFLAPIELIFLRADRSAHVGKQLEYSIRDRDRFQIAQGVATTSDAGKVILQIPRHAQSVFTALSASEAAWRSCTFLPDGSQSAANDHRKKFRRACAPVARNGSVEVIDPAQCLTAEGVMPCSFDSDKPHTTMERVVLGDFAALRLKNNFDNPMQASKYDVLTDLGNLGLERTALAKLRASSFQVWDAPVISDWRVSAGKYTAVGSGLLYISSGRADVIAEYLALSPLVIWCLATGRSCDIVVDFTEFAAYEGAVNTALPKIAKLVMGYGLKLGTVPKTDSDELQEKKEVEAAKKETATASSAAVLANKNVGKPAVAASSGSTAASSSSASASSSSSGSTDKPGSQGSPTSATAATNAPTLAEWKEHVSRHLRVVAPAPAGLQDRARGFGFNRHIGMLWMMQRFTDICATVDDNTFGFDTATAEAMEWLFNRGNIVSAVAKVGSAASSSSSSGKSAWSPTSTKAGDWLALAFAPCTQTLDNRTPLAHDKAQYGPMPATPVLQRCAGQNLFIQQLTVWNVTRYRELYSTDRLLMNYDVNFVTGKEDMDFHCRLVNNATTSGLLFGARKLKVIKCRFSDVPASAPLIGAPVNPKTASLQHALAERIGKFSPCFARIWAENNTEVLQLIQSKLYGNSKVAPSDLNALELVKRINMALEQIFVTQEKK